MPPFRIPEPVKVGIVASLAGVWTLVWCTSRVDVALHLVTWVVLAGFAAGHHREVWLTNPALSLPVDASQDLSFVVRDTFGPLATPVALLLTLAALSALSGANKKESKRPKRATWMFFATVRVLLPLSLASVSNREPIASTSYVAVFVASLVGPISSWPSRCFALADATYALTTMDRDVPALAAGTEAAVVAAFLCLAHDLAASRFLFLLEEAAYFGGLVFIIEYALVVLRQPGLARGPSSSVLTASWYQSLNAWGPDAGADSFEWLATRAAPAFLAMWGGGMHVRTLAQKRVSLKEFLVCTGGAALFGASILLGSANPQLLMTRPMFAAVVLVGAMALSARMASHRPSKLRPNVWIPATGLFGAAHHAHFVMPQHPLSAGGGESAPTTSSGASASAQAASSSSSTRGDPSTLETAGGGATATATAAAAAAGSPVKGALATTLQTAATKSPRSSDASVSELPLATEDDLRMQYEQAVSMAQALKPKIFRMSAMLGAAATPEETDKARKDVEALQSKLKQLEAVAEEKQKELIRAMEARQARAVSAAS